MSVLTLRAKASRGHLDRWLVLLVVVLVIFGFAVTRSDTSLEPKESDVAGTAQTQRNAATEPIAWEEAPQTVSVANVRVADAGPDVTALTPQELVELGVPFEVLALSREESAWLRRNGYPRAEEIENLQTLDLTALQRRVDGGDSAAMALLGMRLGGEAGRELLERAEVHGSRFAMLEMLRQSPPTEATTAHASMYHAYAAALLGDHRASGAMSRAYRGDPAYSDFLVRTGLSGGQAQLSHLNRQRAALGMPPLVPDPRPGFVEWETAFIFGSIPVYTSRGG